MLISRFFEWVMRAARRTFHLQVVQVGFIAAFPRSAINRKMCGWVSRKIGDVHHLDENIKVCYP